MKNRILNNKACLTKLLLILIILIAFVGFIYYKLAVGFGDAIINTSDGITKAKKSWVKGKLDPIDSIKDDIDKFLGDSSVYEISRSIPEEN